MKRVLYGALAVLLTLVLGEAIARVLWTVQADRRLAREAPERARALVYTPDLGWQHRPGYRGVFDGGARAFDEAGHLAVDSPKLAATGRRRIVFVGDSNTFGFGVRTDESFVQVVERLVPGVHAINLGVIGYSSYQGRRVVEQRLSALEPDLVVIAFNFNDRRAALPEQGPDGPAAFARAYRASHGVLPSLAAHLERSYLSRGMRAIITWSGVSPGLAAGTDDLRLDALVPRVDGAAYREHLTAMAEQARHRGIPVLLVAMRDNPLQTAQLRKGLERLAASDLEGAVTYLTAAVEARTLFSDLARLHLARAHRARGDAAQAAGVLAAPRPWRDFAGGPPIRPDTEYNDIMRQVAGEAGTDFVDVGAVLEASPYDFIDAVHFNAAGHRRVAEMLADRVSRMLAGVSPRGARPRPARRARPTPSPPR